MAWKKLACDKRHLNRAAKPPVLNKLKKSEEKPSHYSIIPPSSDKAMHLHHRSALIYLIYWKSMATFGRSS